jgi:predicted acyl esterase
MGLITIGALNRTSADESAAASSEEAARQIARAAAQLPAWMAKSSREEAAVYSGKIAGPDFTGLFSKSMAQIVARDGIELHTEIYAPVHAAEALPMIARQSLRSLRQLSATWPIVECQCNYLPR